VGKIRMQDLLAIKPLLPNMDIFLATLWI
jgi:hypothetical protein